MAWRLTHDVDEFLAEAGGFLRSRPTENNLLLTTTDRLRREAAARATLPAAPAGDAAGAPTAPSELPFPETLFGWWDRGDAEVAGTFMHTPPFPVVLGGDADPAAAQRAARDLAAALARAGHAVPAVNGCEPEARTFAEAWCDRTGTRAEPHMRTRLYRLGTLVPPDPAPLGGARVAGEADAGVVLGWIEEFATFLGEPFYRGLTAERLRDGSFMLWEVDGVAVSLAGGTRVVAGVARVGPVWTPVEHRRHGYGAAVTAAISRKLVDAGAEEVVLFTDLANPTSNSIYQRIGYRPVHDRLVLRFTPR